MQCNTNVMKKLLLFIASAMVLVSCNLGKGENVETYSYGFSKAEVKFDGFTTPGEDQVGYWTVILKLEDQVEAYLELVSDADESKGLPAQTYKCAGYTSTKDVKYTFIPGDIDADAVPVHTHIRFLSDDGDSVQYGLFTDGTITVTKESNTYTIDCALKSYNTNVILYYKGEPGKEDEK